MFRRLRDKHPGSPLGSVLLYALARSSLRLGLGLFYHLRIDGAERVPASGPILLVSNHQSFLDPPVIGSPVHQRQLDYVARMGLFKASSLFGRLIHAFHALPIKEEGGDTGAIKEILRRLENGRAVLIFPEGSRSDNGAMSPFKRGVAVLVKRSRCPVLPVALEGCFDAWPRGRRWPRFGPRIAVRFGNPISHEELMSGGPEAALERLTAEVDAMRLALRRQLQSKTRGRFPAPGPGDLPITAVG